MIKNKITPYKIQKIFNYPNYINKNIKYLKKKEFDIYYSCYYKYPLLVVENINKNSGKTDPKEPKIDRALINDPFMQDAELPIQCQHSPDYYKNIMKYGLSMGHNAPAGTHKTNYDIYSETYLMSNICPQEMTFNSGIWVLIESWIRSLPFNNKLTNIYVFTGSIPNDQFVKLDNIKINIPTKMFKVIFANHIDYPNTLFTCVIMMNNNKFFVKKMPIYKFNNFTTTLTEWQIETKIDLLYLLEQYNLFNFKKKTIIQDLSKIIKLEFIPPFVIQLQMQKSNWYGRIIYAKSLTELENVWTDLQKMKDKFRDLQYHEEYYIKIKNLLITLGKK